MIHRASDVAIVTNAYSPTIGGITTYIAGLQSELSKRGYRVHIFSYPHAMAKREAAMPNPLGRRLIHELVVMAFTFRTLGMILLLRMKARKVVVHSQSASFCLGIGVMARVLNVRAVHTFHSPIERSTSRLKVFLALADVLVCVSEEQRAQYVAKGGIPENAPIVPGGVDCSRFAPIDEKDARRMRAEVLKELDIRANEAPIILFAGRIVKEKGAGVLLEAAKKINARIGPVVFLLVGPLQQVEGRSGYVEDLNRQAGSVDYVHLVGGLPMEKLARVYGVSDLFVFPSLLEESSPMVVVEAMASGLPVVAARKGAMESRVIDNVTGRLVAPGNPDALADAIITMLQDPKGMRDMGRKSRELAVERYSLEAMADAYERLYRVP